MSDIELVIKIPEEKLSLIKNKRYCGLYDSDLYKAIANGTPLDKLVDAINTAWTIDDLDNLTSAMLTDMIKALPPVNPKQTEITLESAIDYLHSIGWLQKHDKELTEGVKQEPKTGHWIDINSKDYELHRIYKCSECGKTEVEYPESIYVHYKYCPNCGSKMIEG